LGRVIEVGKKGGFAGEKQKGTLLLRVVVDFCKALSGEFLPEGDRVR